ncbi:hypothetical protein SteCoe_1102 [Stentor coeruleus]|uniref:Uncharacterized protein n=1 Tax=Stentor coeruleus TaxID=5963 RepID=A0A1R2D2L3_9CILI|nr:hypothetical protein SteCoe_1102 [Stentor coeruleus]
MRLKIKQQEKRKHSEMVTAVGWTSSNQLYSCSDDNSVYVWDMNGEAESSPFTLDTPVTSMSWQPAARGISETLALSCTDGSFKIVNRSGRVEKQITKAHEGAVICIKWSHDSSTIATGGEEGDVKIWAKTGILRSTLAQNGKAVFAVAWSPNSEQLLFASHRHITIKYIQAGQKQIQWKAHEGCVLAVDWNPTNNLIISGGEDCKYKIWDCFGRNLYSASPYEYVITSVAWSPNGQLFTVGAYDMIRLCEKTGWTYSFVKPNSGSIMNLSWSLDGTMLAGAGGNGSVVFGYLVDKKASWENVEIQLKEDNKIHVIDVIHEITEELEFMDRVINFSLGFGHLVVTTSSQCFIYSVQNWQSPSRMDIRESASLIVLSSKYFSIVDISNGIQIFNYEGKQMSNPKFSGLRVEFLSSGLVSISNELVSVVDTSNGKIVRLFELISGKPSSHNAEHTQEVIEVALNQTEHAAERKLCILDSNRDLFLTSAHRNDFVKLCSMVDSFRWNESNDMLAAISDGKLYVWYYPNVVYVDKDLLILSRAMKDVSNEVGKMCIIDSFTGSLVTVRRVDGRIVTLNISPYPALLYETSDRGQWAKAIKLCRFVKDRVLWACLAAMALYARELNTAEIALAAIDEVDKIQFINYVKMIPSEAGRNAELALFSKRLQEAEQILLQSKLYYRAIKMNIKLYKWERALDIAFANKKHVDTVLGYRKRYLEKIQREESMDKFIKLMDGGIEVNWVAIKTKIKQEKEAEALSGKPYEAQ